MAITDEERGLKPRHLAVLRALLAANGEAVDSRSIPDGNGRPGGATARTMLDLMRADMVSQVGLSGSHYVLTDAGRRALEWQVND